MNKDYTYYGLAVTQVQFAAMLAQQNEGTCPICKRTGLTDRYGSKRKHISSCVRKSRQRADSKKRGVVVVERTES